MTAELHLVSESDEDEPAIPTPTDPLPAPIGKGPRAGEAPTRDQLRSRRPRDVRAHTVQLRQITQHVLTFGRLEVGGFTYERPKRRGDCGQVPRPCPFASCRWNLYLDESAGGGFKLNFPDLEPEDMPAGASCALDIADRGGSTLEEVGAAMNVTRERVRQVEVAAFRKILPKILKLVCSSLDVRIDRAASDLPLAFERLLEAAEIPCPEETDDDL